MGADGDRNVVVNSVGREIEQLGRRTIRPTARGCSSRSTTTCSGRSRRRSEQTGSPAPACFWIRSTGEILAMTSLPAYDPNDFAVGIEAPQWAELNRDPLKPLTTA